MGANDVVSYLVGQHPPSSRVRDLDQARKFGGASAAIFTIHFHFSRHWPGWEHSQVLLYKDCAATA